MTLSTAKIDRTFTHDLLALLQSYPYVSLLQGNRSVGYLTLSPDRKYVRVTYYGQYSARATHTVVKDLFDNVLDDITAVTPAQYSEYHCNVAPLDTAYTCADLSSTHPNVWGK